MKFGLIGLLLLSVSCGRYKVSGGSSSIGELRALTPTQIDDDTSFALNRICSALKAKNLVSLANTNHSYAVSQTNCDGSVASADVVENTTIQPVGSNYYFKKVENGLNFIFPEVDTDTFGEMASVCSALASSGAVNSPYKLSNGDAQWVTTGGISTNDCVSNDDETCVLLETASPSGESFKVHTKEWIRFRIKSDQAKYGFFSYRKKISRSFCSESEFVTSTATLK